jgi:hypothetical protein
VREDVFDEDFLVSIVNFRNQAIVIAFDIEDCASPYGVGVPKSSARFHKVAPVGFLRQFVPLFQRRLGIGMCFPELAQSPFADDSHSAIPFNDYTRILRVLSQAGASTDLKMRRSRSKPPYPSLTVRDPRKDADRAHCNSIKVGRVASTRTIWRLPVAKVSNRANDSRAAFFNRRQGGSDV